MKKLLAILLLGMAFAGQITERVYITPTANGRYQSATMQIIGSGNIISVNNTQGITIKAGSGGVTLNGALRASGAITGTSYSGGVISGTNGDFTNNAYAYTSTIRNSNPTTGQNFGLRVYAGSDNTDFNTGWFDKSDNLLGYIDGQGKLTIKSMASTTVNGKLEVAGTVSCSALQVNGKINSGLITTVSMLNIEGVAGKYLAINTPLIAGSALRSKAPNSSYSSISLEQANAGDAFSLLLDDSSSLHIQGKSNTAPSDYIVVSYNGNVGIGTTTPTTKLEVAGTVSSSALIINDTGTTSKIRTRGIGSFIDINGATGSSRNIRIENNGQITYIGSEGSSSETFANSRPYATVIGNKQAYATQLFTNNLARLTILSDGKIGIGTNTPNTELEVNGTISGSALQVNGNVNNSTGAFIIGNGVLNTGYKLNVKTDASNTEYMQMSTGTRSDHLFLQTGARLTGNVGIGIAPTTKLEVDGTVSANEFGGAWTAWTVSWNQSVVSATYGTNQAFYKKIGKTVFFTIHLSNSAGGTAGAGNSNIAIRLPIQASTIYTSSESYIGSGTVSNGGTFISVYPAIALSGDTFMYIANAYGSYLQGVAQNNAQRWIKVSGQYECQ